MNLLRKSIANPKNPVQVSLEENFDFNKTPLAPPGTKVVINKKLGKHKFWYHMRYRDGIGDHQWNTTDSIQYTSTKS